MKALAFSSVLNQRSRKTETQELITRERERDLLLTGGCVFRQLWIFDLLNIKWKSVVFVHWVLMGLSDKDKGRREKRERDGDRVRRREREEEQGFCFRFMPLTTEAVL